MDRQRSHNLAVTYSPQYPSGDPYKSWEKVTPPLFSPKADTVHNHPDFADPSYLDGVAYPSQEMGSPQRASGPIRLNAHAMSVPTAVGRTSMSLNYPPPAQWLVGRKEHQRRLDEQGIAIDMLHQDNSQLSAPIHERGSVPPSLCVSPKEGYRSYDDSGQEGERASLLSCGRYSTAEAGKYRGVGLSRTSKDHFLTTSSLSHQQTADLQQRSPYLGSNSGRGVGGAADRGLMEFNKWKGRAGKGPVYAPKHAEGGCYQSASHGGHAASSSHGSRITVQTSSNFLNQGRQEQVINHHSTESGKKVRTARTTHGASFGSAAFTTELQSSFEDPWV